MGNDEEKGLYHLYTAGEIRISGATVQRLKRNMSVSTNTLSDLCGILDCELEDVALYIRNDKDKFIKKTDYIK